MHPAAREWVSKYARPGDVLDVGGRDINGTVRDLFPGSYTVIDLEPGPNVDVVGDVTEWDTDERFDVVVCCEVFEHTDKWQAIIDRAGELLRPGGRLIVTAAGPGRMPHSAHDGEELRDGEWYANVTALELIDALADWTGVKVSMLGPDVRAVATR